MDKLVKPGWKTTEFWLTLIGQIIGLGVMVGWIPQPDSTELTGAAGKVVSGVFAALVLWKYIHGRAIVKS